MVKGFIASAALAAASIASVAQAATLKQNPLFGCTRSTYGLLYLGADSDVNLGFVAGHTEKSLVTGKKDNSVLDTFRPNGDAIASQYFELLNCTQSLIDRGYSLNVPANMVKLATTLGSDLTYLWGVVQPERYDDDYDGDYLPYTLSVRSKADAKGRLNGVRLLETKVADTPVEARTFVAAYDSATGNSYLDFYPFAGKDDKPKSGVFYTASNKYGSIAVSTNHTAHADSNFLVMHYD